MSISPLKNSDVMILSQNSTNLDTSNIDLQLANLCNNIGATIVEGGNVIIPIQSTGLVLDLFQLVGAYLYSLPVSRVPMYFVSSIGEPVLKYADISAEWLKEQRQEISYRPEMPFKHSEYLETGRLFCFNSIYDICSTIHSPSVVFVGHPSLKFGDVTHFINMWKHDHKNAVIFTDPDCKIEQAMASFIPYNINTIHCPISENLQGQDLITLINECNPKRLISATPIIEFLEKNIPSSHIEMIPMEQSDITSFKSKRKFERANLSFEIASSLKPRSIGGLDICSISGTLINQDGKLTISSSTSSHKTPKLLWGIPTLERLLLALEREGIYDMTLKRDVGRNVTVNIPSLEASILFDSHQTIIDTNVEESRMILRDIVVQNIFNRE